MISSTSWRKKPKYIFTFPYAIVMLFVKPQPISKIWLTTEIYLNKNKHIKKNDLWETKTPSPCNGDFSPKIIPSSKTPRRETVKLPQRLESLLQQPSTSCEWGGRQVCFCIHPWKIFTAGTYKFRHSERKMIFQISREICSMLIFRGENLEPFDDPGFGWSLGLVLGGWSPKIEDKQVPGIIMYIHTW